MRGLMMRIILLTVLLSVAPPLALDTKLLQAHAQTAESVFVPADAASEVAAALYAASATQEAAERAASERISAQRDEIEALRLQVALGEADRNAAVAELRDELTRKERAFVAELEARDRAYAEEIAVFRNAIEDIASTPEGLRALALFNDGDELGALAILDDLRAARDRARQVRVNIESAAEARRIAQLALEARLKGKLTTADLIARYEEITGLDPGVYWDWVELGRLHIAAGDLGRALRAARMAAETAATDRDRGIALSAEADLNVALGDLPTAREAFRKVSELMRARAAADPDNTGWQRDLFVSLDRIGDVQRAQGDLAAALRSYRQSFEIAERLAAADPDNTGWQRDLSVSLDRIGDVETAQGDLAAALRSYRQSFEIFESASPRRIQTTQAGSAISPSRSKRSAMCSAPRATSPPPFAAIDKASRSADRLAAADPDNTGWQRDLSVSLNKIGDVETARGDLAAALRSYRQSFEIFERLAAADPDNTGWQRDLSVSLNKIGDVETAQGDLAAALRSYRQSFEIAERLAAADPDNTGWQRDLSVSLNKIGDVETARGDLAAALRSYRQSFEIFERLAAADPDNTGWQRDLSVSLNKIGDVETAQGDLAAALRSYRQSFEIAERLAAADPDNTGWQRDLSVSLEKIGDVETAQGDLAAALRSYRQSFEIRERLAAADPSNMAWQRDVWVSMWRLRRFPESGIRWRDIVNRMEDMVEKGTLLPTDYPYLETARSEANSDVD